MRCKKAEGRWTKEELSALKAEIGELNRKLTELTEEELREVTGGIIGITCSFPGCTERATEHNAGNGQAVCAAHRFAIWLDV